MGFTVKLYTFSKKLNSTARPDIEPVSYTCRIKEPCGIFNPVISLDLGLTDSPREYNYVYIPTFDRYYFVREWTFQNALWYASLEVDALASWKITIGNSTCYVLRSSDTYDLDITDTTYPGKNKTTTYDHQSTSPWITSSIDDGMFVVGVAGQSTTYYLFYKNALDLFFDYLFSDVYINQLIGDWSIVFPQAKAQANPIQFITSIMWIPFITSGTSIASIRVGFVDVPCVADKVEGSGIRAGEHSFDITRHPQASRGKYLNNSPFTSYSLFYPPWGTIPLDPDIMANTSTLFITWLVDLRTGQGTLIISGGLLDTHVMSWTHTQVGLNYQVSQVLNKGFGIGNILAPLIGATLSAGAGNYAGAATTAIGGGVGAIGDASQSKIPSATTIGSNGGLDSLRGLPALQYEFKEIVDEDLDHRGRPLCTNKRLNTMSGYIMVKDADIDLPATKQEQEAIRSHLEGGFFYE